MKSQQHICNDISPGARSLLQDCIGATSGQRLLLVREPEHSRYYDQRVPSLAAAAARKMGLRVYEMQVPEVICDDADRDMLLQSLPGFDHVVFFARAGDQLRFSRDLPPSTMCYTLNGWDMDSSFATACYQGLCEIKSAVDRHLQQASEIEIRCPLGTQLLGRPGRDAGLADEVGLKRFPMLVARPFSMRDFSGQVVLSRFIVGTGSRPYDPYLLPLRANVVAHVDGTEIRGFSGPADLVNEVEQHYRHVAGLFGLESTIVHSWHAGIHPGCEFTGDATSDIHRWCGSAFGSPRILHFHTCGDFAPGEICWNILDPTILVDGEPLWDRGRLMISTLPDHEKLFNQHSRLVELYQAPPKPIGIEFA